MDPVNRPGSAPDMRDDPTDRFEIVDRPAPRLHEMSAVILCGGMGTRLREETEFKPKPMVEIGGKPILWHIMKHYHHFGVRNFVLCLGYRGDVIRDYFLNYQTHISDVAVDLRSGGVETLSSGDAEDWRVVLAETGAETLTGSRVRQALRYVRGNTFFCTYGDGVSNVDMSALLAHHRRTGRSATVTAVHPSSRYGELSIDGGIVKTFREKPQINDGWINGGFMVFERAAFSDLKPNDNDSLEQGVLEKLANREDLAVYQHGGFWQSMDTYREMCLLNEMWAGGKAPWRTWEPCRLSA